MIITLELRVAARCKVCSVLTPVPGIRNALSCRNCAAPIDFAKRAKDGREGGLRYPFGAYYDALAEAALLLEIGKGCRDARDSHGTSVTLTRVAGACCGACQAPLPRPEAGADGVTCPQCGDHVAVRWPDDETRKWDARISYVVGDGKGRGKVARDAAAQGAVVTCGECGGTIAGEGQQNRRRSRTCNFCGAPNYLTDAAWLALFPAPEWHRSFLVYELDERAMLALHDWLIEKRGKYWIDKEQLAGLRRSREQARGAARQAVATAVFRGDASPAELAGLAVDPTLNDAEAAALDAQLDDHARLEIGARAAPRLVLRWIGSPTRELRAIVAGHAGCGAEQLTILAEDDDVKVRHAVAARTDAPPELLARLRKDPDEKVVKAVRENPSYKPGFFERVFG